MRCARPPRPPSLPRLGRPLLPHDATTDDDDIPGKSSAAGHVQAANVYDGNRCLDHTVTWAPGAGTCNQRRLRGGREEMTADNSTRFAPRPTLVLQRSRPDSPKSAALIH